MQRPTWAALALLATAATGLAQTDQQAEPATEREVRQSDAEAARSLETPSPVPVYRGIEGDGEMSGIPGLDLGLTTTLGKRLIPEGAFLSRRQGIIVPIADDRWAFVFDADVRGMRDEPMILQPCARLAQMVSVVSARPETVTFLVDGRVYVYRDNDYLLPTRFEIAVIPSAESEQPNADEPAVETALEEGEPSVEGLLERLESATEEARAESRPTAPSIDPTLTPEQTMIASRRGRLVRSGESWVFAPDNDADAGETSPNEAPFPLMPCLASQEMERLAERHGQRIVFLLSGVVYAFDGRNHVLPTMFIVDHDRDGNLVSAQ